MKCPHCDQELPTDDTAFYNVDRYGEPAVGRTLCCEKLVNIYPIRGYRVEKYIGNKTEDNWGRVSKT